MLEQYMCDWMPKGETGAKIRDIAEMVKTLFIGDGTVTLSGSHAKGMADQYSDIDMIVYFDNPKPYETQRDIIKALADGGEAEVPVDHVSQPWGGLVTFYYKGTFVEITTRYYQHTMRHIIDAMEGRIEILPMDWTMHGFYTYTYIGEISYVKPLWDPTDFIARTYELIHPYPQKLQKAIAETFGARVNSVLNSNHYRVVIERGDIFIASRCVQNVLIDMAQIIFALNDTYFTGDKHIARKLAALPYCPSKLLDNLEFLLSASHERDRMCRQRNMLLDIASELNSQYEALT